ncbi:MAG TPA: AraC family transcriptional regulator [Mesotoga infera]|jgi:AraC-like DNA-binding protein|uniref:AraC family transcriptional regulator n=1 Tax=Mesotoga infera TaxID=1236046 RepID=A0A3D3TM16_9BACT|nr:AraC family transcriptional regulator [Mesotoga infera]
MLTTMVVEVRSDKRGTFEEGLYRLINCVIDYIEENLSEDLTIERLCSKSGYSQVHLQRIFYYSTGQTIGQYIKGRRVSRVAEALSQTTVSILEIAMQWGYESQEAFTRAFKSMYHLTPESTGD